MTIKNIFFDFDGVLAESVHVKTLAYHDMYLPYGKDIADKVVAHHKANGGVSRFEKCKIYHKEHLGIKISQNQLDELTKQYSELVIEKVVNSPEINGATKFLVDFSGKMKYWIITGTPTAEIEIITERRGIKDYFVELCGSPTKKWEWTEYLIEKNSLNRNETLILGDAMSDYKASQISKLHFALRDYEETYELFKDYDVLRFTDFYDLQNKLKLE